ncbi:carbohydrate-binding protein [Chitinibacteraceae bacterium HSL-7]
MASTMAADAWSEGASYTAGAVVSYNGHDYKALVAHTAYVGANWNPAATPTLWQDLGASTNQPDPTPTATPTPIPTPTPTFVMTMPPVSPSPTPTLPPLTCYAAWSAATVYTGGQRVTFNGINYEARWWTQGDDPSKSGDWGAWKPISSCGDPTPTPTPTITPTVTPIAPPAVAQADESQTYATYPSGCSLQNPIPVPVPKWQTNTSYPAGAAAMPAEVTWIPSTWQGANYNGYLRAAQAHLSSSANEPKVVGGSWQIDRSLWKVVAVIPTTLPCPTPTQDPVTPVTPTPTPTPVVGGNELPKHVLVGYLHSSFANGSGYIRMADVSNAWDVINLSFAEPTSATSGQVAFKMCPSTECPNVESEAEFIAAIRAKQAMGKKVQISIGGANGQVRLESAAAATAFVNSVSAIIDKYGLDGLDVDFEGHSLELNAGDNDVANPTSPVIVNLISALKQLKAKYGEHFTLTMAPETFFVQLGYSFYGGNCAGCDRRAGAYLPVIYAMRNDLTLLHVQDYNSGPITGLDNQYHTMGNADFHVAMTDMLLKGFKVAGTDFTFPALRPEQIAIGLPANGNAGGGFTSVTDVHTALNCLMKGTSCGNYKPSASYPAMRGLMTWSVNWDKFNNFEFSTQHRAYFDALK